MNFYAAAAHQIVMTLMINHALISLGAELTTGYSSASDELHVPFTSFIDIDRDMIIIMYQVFFNFIF